MQVNMDSSSSLIISDTQGHCYLIFLRYMFILKFTGWKSGLFLCGSEVPGMSIRNLGCKPVVSVIVDKNVSRLKV